MTSAAPDLEWKASSVADLMAIVDFISEESADATLAVTEETEGKVATFRLIQSGAGRPQRNAVTATAVPASRSTADGSRSTA